MSWHSIQPPGFRRLPSQRKSFSKRAYLLKNGLDHAPRVANHLHQEPAMDEIGTIIDARPRAMFVFEVFDAIFKVWRGPAWLNSGDISSNDSGTGVLFSDC